MASLSFMKDDLYESQYPPLEASASPGLEPLPSQNMPEAAPPLPRDSGLGFAGGPPQGEEVVTATATETAPLNTPEAARAANTGLGLADFKSRRNDDDQAYLDSLPTSKKIGLALQAFGAAVNGQPNPVEVMLESKRRRETEFRNELRTSLEVTQKGMEMVRKMPMGKARDAVIEQIVRQTGGDDMVRQALMAAGTAQEESIKDVVSVISDPAVQTMLTKVSGGDPNKARQLMADNDFMQRAERTADGTNMPKVLEKVRIVSRAMAKMPQFKQEDGTATFTMSDLIEQNKNLPDELKFTDGELGAARRNQIGLVMYGLKPDDIIKKEAEYKALAPEREAERVREAERRKEAAGDQARLVASLRKEPAPTVVEIADPNDPSKKIKIDARTKEKIGDSPAGASGKALPTPIQKQLTEAAEMADATNRFATTFKDDFGGKTIIGGLGNTVGKIVGDDTGQTQWWQDYELHQSQVRNKLFGSALTATETAAWEKSAISPRMDPGEIKKNLERRAQLEEAALGKLIKGASAGGYNKDQIEAYTGRPADAPKGAAPAAAPKAAAGDTSIAAAVKAAGQTYEPTKYDYRIVNGVLQRKAKK